MDTGIILAALSLVVAIIIGIWQIRLAKKQLQLPITTDDKGKRHLPVSEDYKQRPYPEEIIKAIVEVPVFQREQVAKNYQGLKVRWHVTLDAVRPTRKKNQAHLALLDRGNYPWIYCDVDMSKYPELKTAKEGQKLRVAGEIIAVEGNTITLDKGIILFDEAE